MSAFSLPGVPGAIYRSKSKHGAWVAPHPESAGLVEVAGYVHTAHGVVGITVMDGELLMVMDYAGDTWEARRDLNNRSPKVRTFGSYASRFASAVTKAAPSPPIESPPTHKKLLAIRDERDMLREALGEQLREIQQLQSDLRNAYAKIAELSGWGDGPPTTPDEP